MGLAKLFTGGAERKPFPPPWSPGHQPQTHGRAAAHRSNRFPRFPVGLCDCNWGFGGGEAILTYSKLLGKKI